MNYQELAARLRDCAGEPDDRDLYDPTNIDVPFDDLGYDSISLIEFAARLQDEIGVKLSEDDVGNMATPRAALEMINDVHRLPATGGESRRTDNSVVINAPLDIVWAMTNDVTTWPELFAEYASTEVLERRGDEIDFRLVTRPNASGQVYSWVSRRAWDPVTHTVRAQRIETGPFKFMNLYWFYRETAAGTEMRWIQVFEMSEEAPYTGDQMKELLDNATQKNMDHIRTFIEKSTTPSDV